MLKVGLTPLLDDSPNEGEAKAEVSASLSDDPRAYKNKSVWARMQIITAGVIMAKLIETPALAIRDRIFPPRSGKSGAAVIEEPEKKAASLPSPELSASAIQ